MWSRAIHKYVKQNACIHVALFVFVFTVMVPGPFPGLSLAGGQPPVPNPKPAFLQDDFKDYLNQMAEAIPVTKGRVQRDQLSLYKEIFELQSNGDMKAANEKIRQLVDPRLMGHVLYQRYMHKTYVSKPDELASWLKIYADHPGAKDIYRLAKRKGATSLENPAYQSQRYGAQTIRADFRETYISDRKRSSAQRKAVTRNQNKVHQLVRQGRPTQALSTLRSKKSLFDQTEYNVLQSRIAAGYMYTGNVEKSLSLAAQAAKQSGENVPLAGWVAGLASWRLNKFEDSARYFEMAAKSPYANGWTISGAAFWASRAHMRIQNFQEVSYWLNRASEYPRTFYGLIALKVMNRPLELNLHIPAYERRGEDVLMQYEAGIRALALQKIGQSQLAESELTSISVRENEGLKPILLGYAMDTRMASLSWSMGHAFRDAKGNAYDAALYPLMPWEPRGGFTVDRALIHAFARQESRFEPAAGNPSGATGLLQVMPATAMEIAEGIDGIDMSDGDDAILRDPESNLSIGQEYMHYLFRHYTEEQDLFSLMIAWNAGPGNLKRWQGQLDDIDDPLLFIESIPAYETRAFVERVMTNFWIYRMRLGERLTSLDDVASGKRPRYVSQEPVPEAADIRVAISDE